MEPEPSARERLHAGAGLVWPAMPLVSLAVLGRAARVPLAFVAEVDARSGWAAPALALFVASLLVWLATAALGGFSMGVDPDLRRLRRLLVLPAVAFAVSYAWWVWVPVALVGADGRALHESLVGSLSHPVPAWLYAVGAAFTALQWEQSMRAAADAFAFPRHERARHWSRGLAIAAAAGLLFFVYDGLGALIAGRALFGGVG